MRREMALLASGCLLVAAASEARPARDELLAIECRLLQRSVQRAVAEASARGAHRGEIARVIARALRQSRRAGLDDCKGCIMREFARSNIVTEQEACGLHGLCSTGDPLDVDGDPCVAGVCDLRSACCRKSWDEECVDLAVTLCDLDCTECTHDPCIQGLALPEDCDPCTTIVCASDPYCCDTAWDETCVTNTADACGLTCSLTATTTTMPQCISDEDCADSDACTVDTCFGGSCVSRVQACDDNDSCTNDWCDPGFGCRFEARACDDGNPCTQNSCIEPGSASWTAALQAGAVVSTDGCVHEPAPGCVPCGTASDCDDGNACTSDTCTARGTCSNPPAIGGCDDGNACTIGDRCVNGSCVGGPPLDCNDSNVCTVDWCAAGTCRHFAPGCSDGDACTLDSCDPVSGCGHQVRDCDDGNPCTSDSCDLVAGCAHTPIPGCGP